MMQFPMLRFLERHGSWASIAVAAIPLVVTAILVVNSGVAPAWMLLALVIAAVLYVATRSYVELVRLMVDMLMPK